MAATLTPGNLIHGDATDYSQFVNSMAEEIEKQLDSLMQGDHLPPLVQDPSDRSVRDRRRLFVAIARGVVKHLADNPGAFAITTNNVTITAQLDHITTL